MKRRWPRRKRGRQKERERERERKRERERETERERENKRARERGREGERARRRERERIHGFRGLRHRPFASGHFDVVDASHLRQRDTSEHTRMRIAPGKRLEGTRLNT